MAGLHDFGSEGHAVFLRWRGWVSEECRDFLNCGPGTPVQKTLAALLAGAGAS
jgi:hypothetical protein